MAIMVSLAVFIIAALGSAAATGLLLAYARARNVLDVPAGRSAHALPTPRGAGPGFLLCLLMIVVLLRAGGQLTVWQAVGLLAPALLVCILGWADDHRRLEVRTRLAGQALAIIPGALLLAPVDGIDFGLFGVPGGVAGMAVVALAWLWFVNAFNFMDGADGFAATQALLAGIAAGGGCLVLGDVPMAALAMGLAGIAAGFLVWNLPPARLFMGDSGSYFFGSVFTALGLLAEQRGTLAAPVWTILLAPFIWDASLTLLARLAAGEPPHRPHASHAYQRLLRAGMSHSGLAGRLVALNLLVCWPLAAIAAMAPVGLAWAFPAVGIIMAGLWLLVRIHTSPAEPP